MAYLLGFPRFIIIEAEIKGRKSSMPAEDKDQLIEILLNANAEQKETIESLRSTIKSMEQTIINLNETLDELKRKLFGTSSEKVPKKQEESVVTEEVTQRIVKEHVRKSKPKSVRADLYDKLPIREVKCDVPEEDRNCPDCDTPMQHMGYTFVREELRIIPAKVERVRYMAETLVCPTCKQEDDTTIIKAKVPTALMPHSLASPDMVATVMYDKIFMDTPFYRQEKDWKQKGVPLTRSTMVNWFNSSALLYLAPIVERLHQELIAREVLHVDEVPCQVLHEEGKAATSKSYIWVYLSGKDGKPPIVLYDYRPGRSGDYPIEFLDGFIGMVHCDGYSAYGRIQDVTLVCCMAHCRRKFFEAIPTERRNKLKLLDINSDLSIDDPDIDIANATDLLPAEKGVLLCNKLFFLERQYKDLTVDERKEKRLKTEVPVWKEFWKWLDTIVPTGGSKLEKAVNYSKNHKEELMNYLLDGRCQLSNNAAEREVKAYVMSRKNFLFHGTVDGANASAIVFSLVETAKANNLNVFQYLYTLLLYMPDYKNESAGIEMMLPWSEFIQENCSGITDTEKLKPETRGNLPL